MGMYVAGTAGLAGLYAAVLGVGIWSAAAKRKKASNGQNHMILANRELGLFLGVFSLVATCIGDTFVNGTAEGMSTRGLAWCQVPIGYSLSLLFGALLFAKPMRKAEHVTMLDPFQQHYGARVGGLLFLPALCGDLFWCAAVLRALGSSLSVVGGIEPSISICGTALLVTIYIVSGGLYSVACTGALQLICIGIGLAIAAPYAALNPAVSFDKNLLSKDWIGEIRNDDLVEWLDVMLLAIFGGIPWQGYFQRILSIKSTSFARTLSIASMFGCLALAVPSVMIGIVARATDWSLIETYNKTTRLDNGNTVLPLVLRYLTPQWVSFAGLGAISAAVMSSADSSILAISSMFSRNIYKVIMRPKASERELDWMLRLSVAGVSFLSAAIALTFSSVYYLAYLCCDLVYVVLFPQLLAVIHWPSLVDSYGCIVGYFVAIAVRLSGGEKSLGIPVFIEYPFYDNRTNTQKFPFRTSAMLSAIFSQLIVSFFTRNLLGKGYFPRCCDVLNVYAPGNMKNANGVVQSSSGSALIDCGLNDASPGHMSDAPTLSSSRTDVDSTNESIQQQQQNHHQQQQNHHHQQQQQQQQQFPRLQHNCQHQQQHQNQHQSHYGTISVLYDPNKTLGGGHRPNQIHQLIQTTPGHTATVNRRQSPALHQQLINSPVAPGQVLGVKTLSLSECPPPRIMSPITTQTIICPPYAKSPQTIMQGSADRSNMELCLNMNENHVKKNIKGVKLIGMDGGTLRRPSLQGTFSPTPSVEFDNIFDRRQSGGSYGPSSLSPIPGVEACKTHGTAVGNESGNEHCRIKRGIVRHHSFNDTGDRTLTTLARQPNYPSMPLRTEDCRMTLRKEKKAQPISRYSSVMDEKALSETGLRPDDCRLTLRREKRVHHPMTRHLSVADEKGFFGPILVSPTYSMYNSAVKNCNYFVSDDEAVSRF